MRGTIALGDRPKYLVNATQDTIAQKDHQAPNSILAQLPHIEAPPKEQRFLLVIYVLAVAIVL